MIQIKKEIPNTHFFIYEGKQYPFNMELFKFSSNYFFNNEEKIKENKYIQLIDQNEINANIKDSIIQNFIQYIHREAIPLNNENVVILNFLAHKYELCELSNTTKEYISSHHSEIALDNLIIYQKEAFYDLSVFENIISTHILDYINDKRIFNLDVSILFRIMKRYQEHKNQNEIKEDEENEIIDFLFKCLDKYGRSASILFNDIDIDKVKMEYMNLLITKYSNVFDFHFINSNLMKSLYERSNYIIQFMHKNDDNNERINNIVKSFEEQIKNYQNELNDYKSKNDEMKKELDMMKKQITESKTEHQKQIKLIKEDLDQEKQRNQKLIDQFDELKKEFLLLKNDDFSQIKDEIKECKKIAKENQIKKDVNNEEENIISVPYHSSNQNRFNGLLTKLGDGDASRALSNGIINVTSSSIYSNLNYYFPKNVLNYDNDELCFGSEDKYNSWLCFDFIKHVIKLSHYSIKSNSWGDKGHFHMQSWDVEGSNDLNKWYLLDSKRKDTSIDGKGASNTFNVTNGSNKENYYRYIRIQQKGNNTADNNRIIISCIEFFGQIK